MVRSVGKQVDRALFATKLMFVAYVLCVVFASVVFVGAVLHGFSYLNQECDNDVAYCVGKLFSESKDSFNKGMKEGKDGRTE
jgi:hypothetical protein